MAIIIGTGGTAAVAIGAVAPQAAAITGAVISEGALAAALAAEAAGAAVAAETALATAIAAEAGVTALTGMTVANFWNPVGWVIGGVLVGASQRTSQAVTWGCYKPIIGEVDTKETSIKPITFADLAAHPEVRRVFVCASAASANLPDVEVENRAGQCYLQYYGALFYRGFQPHIMQCESMNRSILSLHRRYDRITLIGSTARQIRMRGSRRRAIRSAANEVTRVSRAKNRAESLS